MRSMLFTMLALSVLFSPRAGAEASRCEALFSAPNGHELIYHDRGVEEVPLAKQGSNEYDVGRTAAAIIQGIPQLLKKLLLVEKWPITRKRPIMID